MRPGNKQPDSDRQKPSSSRTKAATEIGRIAKKREWPLGLVLVVATILAYWPALHGGFLWDDDSHISANATLHTLSGLQAIWFKLGATEQYYPLTFTLFWIGYHLWGLDTFGYHLLTLSLHCVTSLLLWQVLKRLRVRGAFLAGALFALHPVCVMSAAWMTELKNTLSGALALGAAWAYLRFAGLGVYDGVKGSEKRVVPVDWRFYVLALVLFELALLAKTAVSFLPLTLFLIVWWQRERLCWRELWPLLPLLGMAVAMGQVTSYVEQHSGGASGAQFHIGFPERVLISGRSFWFYLGKIFFPWHLTFIYPRWQVNAGVWWQYLYPAATVGVLWGLWKLRRRIGKGPLVGLMHFYISTSFLILILVLYMTRYSFVSDHWQYFGCMSVLALAAAGISRGLGRFERVSPLLKPVLAGTLLLVLGVLTWRQCGTYTNLETLWQITIARNPDSFIAYDNLGIIFFKQGQMDQALALLRKAVEIESNAETCDNLGLALIKQGDLDGAIAELRKAVAHQPDYADAQHNLGLALLRKGQVDEAIIHLQKAVSVQPNNPEAQNSLGNALLQKGQRSEALVHFQIAWELQPDLADACFNLGYLSLRGGEVATAVAYFQDGLRSQPDNVDALKYLAWVLATCPDAALRNGTRAVDLARQAHQLSKGNNPTILATLAAAQAEVGHFSDALNTAQEALAAANAQTNVTVANAIQRQMEFYRKNLPFRDSSLTNTLSDRSNP
jgi:tetratricopeptide (TPR) repeat protein